MPTAHIGVGPRRRPLGSGREAEQKVGVGQAAQLVVKRIRPPQFRRLIFVVVLVPAHIDSHLEGVATRVPGKVVDQLIRVLSLADRVRPGADPLKRTDSTEAKVRQSTDRGVVPRVIDPLNPQIDLLAEVEVVQVGGVPRKG